MTIPLLIGLTPQLRESWLGPHFWYDTIHLARKGWPTLARVLFLIVVLVSMLVMNRTQGEAVDYTKPAELARRAANFATLLIVLQYLLILAILPVYVATAIVEEKENQTLEALTLTGLSDRELVLGKLGARLLHVGSLALVNFPLLAFMHLWGNVDATMLVYHEVHLFLLLLSAGSVCMWVSTHSESVFQAISTSYGWLAGLGLLSLLVAFALPWMSLTRHRSGEPNYVMPLALLALAHILVAIHALRDAIDQIEVLRHQEQRGPRKMTGALTLTDDRPVSTKVGKRGQAKSRIHPLAWPVWDNALLWKECLKDGTTFSLSIRWLFIGMVAVAVPCGLCRWLTTLVPPPRGELGILVLPLCFTLSSYIIALAVYTVVVLFQMTMSIALEREQGTLLFLLTLPVERRAIYFAKWLGPWWRNWPILAVCYLGVALGYGSGVYGLTGALVMALAPWPFLLMMGGAAFWLSVVCRRVLFANIAIVGLLGLLATAHIAWGKPAWHAMAYHLALASGSPIKTWSPGVELSEAADLALWQQSLFIGAAGLCLGHSFWLFRKKDYAGN